MIPNLRLDTLKEFEQENIKEQASRSAVGRKPDVSTDAASRSEDDGTSMSAYICEACGGEVIADTTARRR